MAEELVEVMEIFKMSEREVVSTLLDTKDVQKSIKERKISIIGKVIGILPNKFGDIQRILRCLSWGLICSSLSLTWKMRWIECCWEVSS